MTTIALAVIAARWHHLGPVVKAIERHLSRVAAPVLSVAILVVALYQLHGVAWPALVRTLPVQPLFWAGFAVVYAVPPLADWLIYRRLWGAQTARLSDLFRKMIHNDLLIGYAGEASLYARARERGKAAGDALADLKDVSILSAAVGNAVTIAVVLVAWPAWQRLHLHVPFGGLAAGIALALLLSPPLLVLAARARVLRLGGADLGYVSSVHVGRAMVTNVSTLAIWHLALPDVAASVWIALLGLKLLASRLPLVSNKELVFAGAAVAVLGAAASAATLLTLIATLTMLVHAGLGTVLALMPRRKVTDGFTTVRVGIAGVV